jgi:protein-S-isoprenylcysteine O-methyltransferase Ste14
MLKDRGGEHPFGDAGQLIGFLVFLAVWIREWFFLHKSTFLVARVPLVVRLAVMSATLVAAALLIWKSHSFIVHGQRTEKVLDEGAFRFVRHPLYLAGVLTMLGLAVSTGSLLALGVWAVMFVFYNYIAGYEERLLEERFGDTYRAYKARTGKWIPRPGRRGRLGRARP